MKAFWWDAPLTLRNLAEAICKKRKKKRKEKKNYKRNTDFLCNGAVIYQARNFIWIKAKNIKKLLTNIKMSYQILIMKTESLFTFQNIFLHSTCIQCINNVDLHSDQWNAVSSLQMFYICIYCYSNLKDYMILLRYMIVFFQNLHSRIPLGKVRV